MSASVRLARSEHETVEQWATMEHHASFLCSPLAIALKLTSLKISSAHRNISWIFFLLGPLPHTVVGHSSNFKLVTSEFSKAQKEAPF